MRAWSVALHAAASQSHSEKLKAVVELKKKQFDAEKMKELSSVPTRSSRGTRFELTA